MDSPIRAPHIKTVDTDVSGLDFFSVPGMRHMALPKRSIVVNHNQVMERLLTVFWGNELAAMRELAKVIYVDRKGRLAAVEHHASGGLDSVHLNFWAIMQNIERLNRVMYDQVAAVIMAHNHPSGINIHSDADVSSFRHLTALLAKRGVEARDSYILGLEGIFDEDALRTTLTGAMETYQLPPASKARKKLIKGTRSKARKLLQSRGDFMRESGIVGFNYLSRESNLCNGV